MESGDYVTAFQSASASLDWEPRRSLVKSLQAADDGLRGLFSQQRDSWEVPELEQPEAYLLPVHQFASSLFHTLELCPEEQAVPKCFPLGELRKPAGKATVLTQDEFVRNYELFTENMLRFLDWSNVFAAGGSVMACLQPIPDPSDDCNRSRRKYFHDEAYPGSDIDLFLYGLDQKAAEEKILHIYDAVREACPFDVICFRSAHSVSIVSQYPYRHVQIVLRLYSSPCEVLSGFDVDSCSVGFDGSKVWMTPRCHLALVNQYNNVNMSRRSPTYEMRLAKYAKRGFEVAVPGLNRGRINPMLLEQPWHRVQGLAKLLLLEQLRTPEARFRYKEQHRLQQMLPLYSSSFARRFHFKHMMQSPWLAERMENIRGGADASDYSTVFLPWGPGWDAKKCVRLMTAKDRLLNNAYLSRNRPYALHPAFSGTAAQILEDCSPSDPPIPEGTDPALLAGYVRGRIAFIEDDPGRQMIGSFHPTTDGDWADGAYLSLETEALILAANRDDDEEVEQLLSQQKQQQGQDQGSKQEAGASSGKGGSSGVNAMDYFGRSALHVAVMSGSNKVVKVLLQHGASVTARMVDGRTAIHLAVQYGRDAALTLLLERVKEIKAMVAQQQEEQLQEYENSKATATDKEDGCEDGEDNEAEDDEEDEGGRKRGAGGSKATSPPLPGSAPAAAVGPEVPDLDVEDWTHHMSPLHFALVFGRVHAAQLLVAAGASAAKPWVHVQTSSDGSSSKTVMQPLAILMQLCRWHMAAAKQLLRLLINAGCSLKRMDDMFNSYVQLAADKNNAPFIRMLVEEVPDQALPLLDLVSANLTTPLLTALRNGSTEVTEVLLEAGAKMQLTEEDCERARRVFASSPAILKQIGHYTRQRLNTFTAAQLDTPLLLAIRKACTAASDSPSASKTPGSSLVALAALKRAAVRHHLQASKPDEDPLPLGPDCPELTALATAEEDAALGGRSAPDDALAGGQAVTVADRWLAIVKRMLVAGADPNCAVCKDGSTLVDWIRALRQAVLQAHEAQRVAAVRTMAQATATTLNLTDCGTKDQGAGNAPASVQFQNSIEMVAHREAEKAALGGTAAIEGQVQVWRGEAQNLLGQLVTAAMENGNMPGALTKEGEKALGSFAERFGQDSYLLPILNTAVMQESVLLISLAVVAACAGCDQQMSALNQIHDLLVDHSGKTRAELPTSLQRLLPERDADSESPNKIWLDASYIMETNLTDGDNLGPFQASRLAALPPGTLPVKYYMLPTPCELQKNSAHSAHGATYRPLSGRGVQLPASCQQQYYDLFQAVWNGDRVKVESMLAPPLPAGATGPAADGATTEEQPHRQQLFVSVEDSVRHTPLLLAVLRGDTEMIKLLIKIASEQFTPPEVETEDKEHDGVTDKDLIKMNNMSLAVALEELDSNGYQSEDSEDSDTVAETRAQQRRADADADNVVDDVRAIRAAAEAAERRTQLAIKGLELDPDRNPSMRCHIPPQVLMSATAMIPRNLLETDTTDEQQHNRFWHMGGEELSEMWQKLKASDQQALREIMDDRVNLTESRYFYWDGIDHLKPKPVMNLSLFQLAVMMRRSDLLDTLLSCYVEAAAAVAVTAVTKGGAEARKRASELSDPLSELLVALNTDGKEGHVMHLALRLDSPECLEVALRYCGATAVVPGVQHAREERKEGGKAGAVKSGSHGEVKTKSVTLVNIPLTVPSSLYCSPPPVTATVGPGPPDVEPELVGGLMPHVAGIMRKFALTEELQACVDGTTTAAAAAAATTAAAAAAAAAPGGIGNKSGKGVKDVIVPPLSLVFCNQGVSPLLTAAAECRARAVLTWLLEGSGPLTALTHHVHLLERWNTNGRRNLSGLCATLRQLLLKDTAPPAADAQTGQAASGAGPLLISAHSALTPACMALVTEASALLEASPSLSSETCAAILSAALLLNPLLIDTMNGVSALHVAIASDDVDLLKAFVHADGSPAAKKPTLLTAAELQSSGPSPRVGRSCMSPLQAAAAWHCPRAFDLLLSLGASPCLPDTDQERGWNLLAWIMAGAKTAGSDSSRSHTRYMRGKRTPDKKAEQRGEEVAAATTTMVRRLLAYLDEEAPLQGQAMVSSRMGKAGCTALMLAAMWCPSSPELVELLSGPMQSIALAVDQVKGNDGVTSSAGTAACLSSQTVMGRTAMHMAVQARQAQSIVALLPQPTAPSAAATGHLAQLGLEDCVGLTPLDMSMGHVLAEARKEADQQEQTSLVYCALVAAAPDLSRTVPGMETIQLSREYKAREAAKQAEQPNRYWQPQVPVSTDPALDMHSSASKPAMQDATQTSRPITKLNWQNI